MQVNISISDDGNGVQVTSDGATHGVASPRPNSLPEAWWSEARQIFARVQDARARDDDRALLITQNWLGGLLKAAELILPGTDHDVLMQEIMLSTQTPGESWEGIGQIVSFAPLPADAPAEARHGAMPIMQDKVPTRVDATDGDLSVIGELPEDFLPETDHSIGEHGSESAASSDDEQ